MKNGKNIVMAAAAFCVVLCLSGAFGEVVYAAEGWTKESGEWQYLDRDQVPVKNTWKKSKDAWFYLDADGRMEKDRLIENNNTLFYVDEEGKMAVNQWIYVDGERNQAGTYEDGWYYFGSNGKVYRRSGNGSFKRTIDGRSYAFDEDGRMLTGWLDEEGYSITNQSEDLPFIEGAYYCEDDGAILLNKWLDYSQISESLPDFSSVCSGLDYTDYENMWFYFDVNGKKVTGTGDALKQKIINGGVYGFDENGVMLPWWSRVASVSTAHPNNPTSTTSAKYFSAYDGGRLLKDTWLWMYPSESLDEQDYEDEEFSWWHTDGRGEVYRNKIRKINNRYYAFDGLGRMRTGFVLFDGKSEFVAQYDTDVWNSDDFKDGAIYGIERYDLYLFSPDELNDGSMQSGYEVLVELADGVHTFGFSNSGQAFGNQNRLERKRDSYYINGLKLEADQECGYGVVRVEESGSTFYQVVDRNGRIVKGGRKAVKVGDDGYLLIINNRLAAWTGDSYRPRWSDGAEGPGFYRYDADGKKTGILLAGSDTATVLDGLPSEQRLNFD